MPLSSCSVKWDRRVPPLRRVPRETRRPCNWTRMGPKENQICVDGTTNILDDVGIPCLSFCAPHLTPCRPLEPGWSSLVWLDQSFSGGGTELYHMRRIWVRYTLSRVRQLVDAVRGRVDGTFGGSTLCTGLGRCVTKFDTR